MSIFNVTEPAKSNDNAPFESHPYEQPWLTYFFKRHLLQLLSRHPSHAIHLPGVTTIQEAASLAWTITAVKNKTNKRFWSGQHLIRPKMIRSTRLSKYKSRTGCRTCKRRKVKCDEARPCCIRCVSRNRICEGYGIVIDAPKPPTDKYLKMYPKQEGNLQSIQPKPVASLNTVSFLNHSEAATFELFKSQVVPDMAGAHSSGFWQNIVLPACYSEPAVLHASLALANGARFSRVPRSRPRLNEEEILRLDIINDYNKAIHHLQAHVTDHNNLSSLRVALITCVLFIALELSTCRFEQAIMHLNEGRKLLHSSTHFGASKTKHSEDKRKTLILEPNPESIEDELVSVFADLDLQSTYFGSQRPQLELSAHKPPNNIRPELSFASRLPLNFRSIQEANQYLLILTNKCLQFIGQKITPDRHSFQNELSNFRRQHLYSNLINWKSTYDLYCLKVNLVEKSSWAWKKQSALMLIQHAWLSVIIPTSYFGLEETCFDTYLKEFTTITDLSSSILLQEGESPGGFSLEFGLVAPLSWVMLKCRHPQIRRRALKLMRQAGQEGLWEPKLLSQMGQEYILVEEGIKDLDEVGLLCKGEEEWKHLIPLERRISLAHCFLEGRNHDILYLIFQRKIWDNDGSCISMDRITRRQPYEGLRTIL